jgi:hypothetical protein
MKFHATPRSVLWSKHFEVQNSLLLIDFTVDSKNVTNNKFRFSGNLLEYKDKYVVSVVATVVDMNVLSSKIWHYVLWW